MKKRKIGCSALVFCLTLFLASYTYHKQSEIKLGFQGVLSGVAAAIGDGARKGVELVYHRLTKQAGSKAPG